jgi:hypothetical protein
VDDKHFDYLTKSIVAGSRRGVLHLLALLPVGGWLAAFLGMDETAEGKGRRQRRKKRHKHGRPRRHGTRKQKKCKPKSLAQTCGGKCGRIRNNCKKTVDCGSCVCNPPCPACQVCDPTDGQCQIDPAQDRQTCAGCRICENGECVTDETIVCTASDACHDAGVCDPQTGACTNPVKEDGTPCGTGRECVDGACQEICLALRERCDPNDNQCCTDGPRACAKDGPFSGDVCCIPVGAECAITGFGCCGVDFGTTSGGEPLVALVNCIAGVCCQEPGDACHTTADCCQSGVPLQCQQPVRPDCITAPLRHCCQAAGTPCTGPCQCCGGFCVGGLCSAT